MSSDSEDSSRACLEKAFDLLSRRAHFRRELERKLAMRDFPSTEVRAALDRADELGYLDDLECARQLARARVERKNEGPAKLYSVLARRGADSDTARKVVDEFFSRGEGEVVERAAATWLSRNDWDHDRLARHLANRGFSSGAVISELERTRPRSAP